MYYLFSIFGSVFGIFGILLFLFWLVFPFWAFFKLRKMSERLDAHADHIRTIEKWAQGFYPDQETSQADEPETEPETEPATKAEHFAKLAAQEGASVVKEQPYEETYEPPEPFKWEEFFTKKFFSILGVTSIILAIGFFLTWAFANNWIGPMGRIAIGVLVSLAFLVGGELSRNKYPSLFSALSSIGIAGLIITTYFARNAYGFVSSGESFGLYILEVGAGLVLTLRYESRVLGNFSILGGLFAPLLIGGETNQYALLGYLAVLTLAGFVVSLKHKWPEIIAVLLIGVALFENKILGVSRPSYVRCEGGGECPMQPGWINSNALGYLGFVYVMHILFGAGGIVRLIRDKAKQSIKDIYEEALDAQSGLEMILLILSVVVANFLAYEVFDILEWQHFGFFVLAQGFGFYFLSEYLKKKELLLYRNIATGATMISIMMATVWEIGVENPLPLSIALILEGMMFLYAGQAFEEKWFGLFGRIAALWGTFYLIDSIGEQTLLVPNLIAIVLFLASAFMACQSFERTWEKILGVVALVWGIYLLMIWNFEDLKRLLSGWEMRWVLFIVPAILAGMMSYLRLIPSVRTLRVVSLVLAAGTATSLWGLTDRWNHDYKLSAFMALLIVLTILFGVLASYFVEEEEELFTEKEKLLSVWITLALATFSVLLWGGEMLRDPMRSLLWIAWAFFLLGIGIQKDWLRFRIFGIGVMLFMIAKLYVLDVWAWSPFIRFIAFLGLGVALLSLSFFYQKTRKDS